MANSVEVCERMRQFGKLSRVDAKRMEGRTFEARSGKKWEVWRKRFITGQFGRRFNILGEAEVVSQLTRWTGKESVRGDCWKGRGEMEPVYANREVYGERAKSPGSCVSRGFLPARRVKKPGSAANYLK